VPGGHAGARAREPATAFINVVAARLGRCEVGLVCGAGLKGAAAILASREGPEVPLTAGGEAAGDNASEKTRDGVSRKDEARRSKHRRNERSE
jgi:hypothetical protein